jgi:ribosomal protein S18 acetylase RimI-like enzyme
VRRGFPAAEDLERRVGEAAMLGFHYQSDHALIAVAALKAPSEKHRERLFGEANASVSAVGYALDLGWVLVEPEHRGNGIASQLCGALLDRVPESHVFATTRPSNDAMIAILRRLGFSRTGVTFPHPQRGEELVLFTRPGASGAPHGEAEPS